MSSIYLLFQSAMSDHVCHNCCVSEEWSGVGKINNWNIMQLPKKVCNYQSTPFFAPFYHHVFSAPPPTIKLSSDNNTLISLVTCFPFSTLFSRLLSNSLRGFVRKKECMKERGKEERKESGKEGRKEGRKVCW